MRAPMRHLLPLVLGLALGLSVPAVRAEESGSPAFLLTVFLMHDQSKTLDEIDQHLERTGFWKQFPPAGVEVVSWYVMMGIGQVVTLRVPPDKLRAVNLAIEHSAWGGFRTAFFPTYDFRPVREERLKRQGQAGTP